jgi:uncharacterized protein YutE (UPF0331/DUF86 family)
MMPIDDDYELLLQELLERLNKQASHLNYSLERVKEVDNLTEAEKQERYEALTARFARLQDMLVAPYKVIAHLELQPEKSERLTDLLNFMEKLNLLKSVTDWGLIRRTRNVIAHEYWDDKEKIKELLKTITSQSKVLLDAVEKLRTYPATPKTTNEITQ